MHSIDWRVEQSIDGRKLNGAPLLLSISGALYCHEIVFHDQSRIFRKIQGARGGGGGGMNRRMRNAM